MRRFIHSSRFVGANIPARREQRKRACPAYLACGKTGLLGPLPWKSRISVMIGLILDSLIP